MKQLIKTAALSIILLAPTVVMAQVSIFGGGGSGGGFLGITFGGGADTYGSYGCTATICGIAATVLYIINSILVPIVFAVAFIMFLFGIANAYIFSQGDETRVAKGHKLILWGLVAFAVMISIWGLVNVVANTFGLNGYIRPDLPNTY